jgi:hypothetical protein
MSETNAISPTSPTVKKVEIVKVTMTDGRVVEFAGKRNMNKGFVVKEDSVTSTFDFRTGDSLSWTCSLGDPMLFQLAGHGTIQKAGDEAAGVKGADGQPDVPSMVLAVESVLTRLANTQASIEDRWFAESAAGDSFSGASTVMKALLEATNAIRAAAGKTPVDIAFIKAMLEKRLETGKAEGLTRQKLYQSFRRPGTKTAAIIERLDRERAASAAPSVDVEEELNAFAA